MSETELKRKCNNDKCDNDAEWRCIGEACRFGVALTTYYCSACKPTVKYKPKIMSYNNLGMKWEKMFTDEEKIELQKEFHRVNKRGQSCLIRYTRKNGESDENIKTLFNIKEDYWFNYLLKAYPHLKVFRNKKNELEYKDA